MYSYTRKKIKTFQIMLNSIKIIQVTPGVIPIPPNGWGAVEKIIWEYKLSLDRLGYNTDIKYCDDIHNEPNQIVHVHMANLAKILHNRGIEYVFSLHDHHVEHFGKESQCYKDNYEAIFNSKLTFVHSKHLIEYFDNLPQIVYLPHGANSIDYKFSDRRLNDNPKLLMMANNGVGGNPNSDRKGFLIGIEAARELNLEITIVCPSSNKQFFDYHSVSYEKLTILYDLDYEKSIDMFYHHDLFIHPSNLEAGHPNLTITESLSTGLPVVGTMNLDLPGLVRSERDLKQFIDGINKAVKNYDLLISEIKNQRYIFSWELVVSRMLENYKSKFNITQKSQLLQSYNNVNINIKEKQEKPGVIVSFSSKKAFCKTSFFSDGASILFRDRKTKNIIYNCTVNKSPGQWAYSFDGDSFVDWIVEVKQGINVIYSESLDLKDKKVLLKVNNNSDYIKNLIIDFIKSTGCHITIDSNNEFDIQGCCYGEDLDDELFYYTLNEKQLQDYFRPVNVKSEKHLLILNSHALGDSIAFVPYAQKWAEMNNITVDVVIKKHNIFNLDYYKNINFLESEGDFSQYTDVHRFEYIFNKPLQKGYSDQFGLDFVEIKPEIKRVDKKRPIKANYVCLGVHTTTQAKYWNYPDAWNILSKMLRKEGITPVSVDLYESFGIEGNWNYLPDNSVKKVGLQFDDVINHLQHCDFFIGVSSGLSWLAWALGKKVILISGTTNEDNEFNSNCHRVINKNVCHGCFNKSNIYNFDSSNWMWCPVNQNTKDWFICTRTITPELVWKEVSNVLEEITHDNY